MSKNKDNKVEIKPVAWADNDIVTKYQGFVTVIRPDGDVKVMTGDPMPTSEEAAESLKNEIRERLCDVRTAWDLVKDYTCDAEEQ